MGWGGHQSTAPPAQHDAVYGGVSGLTSLRGWGKVAWAAAHIGTVRNVRQELTRIVAACRLVGFTSNARVEDCGAKKARATVIEKQHAGGRAAAGVGAPRCGALVGQGVETSPIWRVTFASNPSNRPAL